MSFLVFVSSDIFIVLEMNIVHTIFFFSFLLSRACTFSQTPWTYLDFLISGIKAFLMLGCSRVTVNKRSVY